MEWNSVNEIQEFITKIRKIQLAELVVVSGHHLHGRRLLCLLPYRDGSVSGGRIAIRPPDMDPDPDRFHPEQKRLPPPPVFQLGSGDAP